MTTLTSRVAILWVAVSGTLLAGPQAGEVPTLHAETRVVQIDVGVRDSRGRAVVGLTKQDFVVIDNGKPRQIDIFGFNRSEPIEAISSGTTPVLKAGESKVFTNRNNGPPRVSAHSTVIVMDQVNAFFEDAGFGRQQVLNMIGKVKPDERIAVYVIVRKQGLAMIQDYTTDHALLRRSVSKWLPRGLIARPMFPVGWPIGIQDLGTGARPPDSVKVESQREAEFTWQRNSEDARVALQVLAEQLAHVPGRKSVYWVTQAFPARLMREMGEAAWDKTLTSLNEANVAVNTVDTRGLFIGSRPAGGTIAAMQEIAERTGGTAYFNRNDMDTAMAEGMESARTSYTLAFYLGGSERDNTFHELKVKSLRRGLDLFYRQGYYAGSTELPPAKGSKDDMDAVLLNPVNAEAIGIAARAEITRDGADGGTRLGTVKLRLFVEPAAISLAGTGSVRTGKVDEIVLEQDQSGKSLVRLTDTKDFEVDDRRRAGFDKNGVSWLFPIPLLSGAVRIAVIMRDTRSGRVGSVVIPLEQ